MIVYRGRLRIFYVTRSPRTRGAPRVRWIEVAAEGPKTITLSQVFGFWRRIPRAKLRDLGLAWTPRGAIALFAQRVRWWRQCALDDLARCDRELAFCDLPFREPWRKIRTERAK